MTQINITFPAPQAVVFGETNAGFTLAFSAAQPVQFSVLGIQGPSGGGGGGGARYQHNQGASSATWTVNHNLGFRPQCEVFSPGWVQIEVAILHATDNQTVITFNTAQTGQAIFT